MMDYMLDEMQYNFSRQAKGIVAKQTKDKPEDETLIKFCMKKSKTARMNKGYGQDILRRCWRNKAEALAKQLNVRLYDIVGAC